MKESLSLGCFKEERIARDVWIESEDFFRKRAMNCVARWTLKGPRWRANVDGEGES